MFRRCWASGREVVTIDMRGYGGSGNPHSADLGIGYLAEGRRVFSVEVDLGMPTVFVRGLPFQCRDCDSVVGLAGSDPRRDTRRRAA
jgi:hypothetical protein